MKLLLEKGADTSAVDKDGWTPLLWAAQNGHETVVKLLKNQRATTLQNSFHPSHRAASSQPTHQFH